MARMTESMARTLADVARRHRCDVRGVVCLASAMGPAAWRGCASVTSYEPKRDGRPHWGPQSPKKPKYQPDVDEDLLYWGLV